MTKENEEYEIIANSLNCIGRLKPKSAPKSENVVVIGPSIPIFKEDAPKPSSGKTNAQDAPKE